MRLNKIFLALVFFFALAGLSVLSAQTVDQSTVPDLYNQIFNESLLVAILAVQGAVKGIRTVINVKGFLAVVVTFVASLAYGLIQFGIGGNGTAYGLIVGTLAALTFFWYKNFGTILAAFGVGNKEGLAAASGRTNSLLNLFSREGILSSLLRILKYLLVRS